jgi:hypothetical protein
MDEPGAKPAPTAPAGPGPDRAGREERLAKALRDNLRRRKGSPKPPPGREDPA